VVVKVVVHRSGFVAAPAAAVAPATVRVGVCEGESVAAAAAAMGEGEVMAVVLVVVAVVVVVPEAAGGRVQTAVDVCVQSAAAAMVVVMVEASRIGHCTSKGSAEPLDSRLRECGRLGLASSKEAAKVWIRNSFGWRMVLFGSFQRPA
jgi:hypothetical protein